MSHQKDLSHVLSFKRAEPTRARLTRPQVGILATVGVASVSVVRQPRLAVLSTGDEVVEPSTAALGPGQIRDCNRAMLLAAARHAGAGVTDLGIARDAEGARFSGW